jgi:hypothetical protein
MCTVQEDFLSTIFGFSSFAFAGLANGPASSASCAVRAESLGVDN